MRESLTALLVCLLIAVCGCSAPGPPAPPTAQDIPVSDLKLEIKRDGTYTSSIKVFLYNGGIEYVVKEVVLSVTLTDGTTRELRTNAYCTETQSSQELYSAFSGTPYNLENISDIDLVAATGWTKSVFDKQQQDYRAWEMNYKAKWEAQRKGSK